METEAATQKPRSTFPASPTQSSQSVVNPTSDKAKQKFREDSSWIKTSHDGPDCVTELVLPLGNNTVTVASNVLNQSTPPSRPMPTTPPRPLPIPPKPFSKPPEPETSASATSLGSTGPKRKFRDDQSWIKNDPNIVTFVTVKPSLPAPGVPLLPIRPIQSAKIVQPKVSSWMHAKPSRTSQISAGGYQDSQVRGFCSRSFPSQRSIHLQSEADYLAQLENAETSKSYANIVDALERLGQVYLLKGKMKNASHLFCAALAIHQVYVQDQTTRTLLFKSLAEAQSAFIAMITKKKAYINPQEIEKRRDRLAKIRSDFQRKLGGRDVDMKELMRELTNEFRLFTEDMVKDCFSVLGPPPCKFALVSMGSMSRRECSPYSDLEFAILVEEASDKNLEYFRVLTEFLELKVVQLGETPFKILQRGLYSPTPSGFCYDSGGNTPLGKKGIIELIGTPVKLADLLNPQWFESDIILSNAMSNLDLITGEEKLLEMYEAKATQILSKPIKDRKILREQRALTLMKDDLLEFKPYLDEEKEHSKVFDIKKELYRLPNSLLHELALFYKLKSKGSWDRIEELRRMGVFSDEGAKNFAWAMNQIIRFRAKTHLHYQAENEKIYYQPQSSYESFQWSSHNCYVLTQDDLMTITKLFQFLLALYEAEKAFCTGDLEAFKKTSLMNDEPRAQALALAKAGRTDEAKEAYKQAIALNPKDLDAIGSYILVLQEHSSNQQVKTTEAIKEYLIKFLRGWQKMFPEPSDAASAEGYLFAYTNLAAYTNAQESVAYCKQAVDICSRCSIKPLDIAKAYCFISKSYLKHNFVEEALKCAEKSRDIYQKHHEQTGEVADSYPAALCNLGVAYREMGMCTESLNCLQKAVALSRNGPGLAIRLTQLAETLKSMGRVHEAIDTLKRALNVQQKAFGGWHDDIAITISQIAGCYVALQDYTKAIFYAEQELAINHALYGAWSETNIPRLSSLIRFAMAMCDWRLALRYSNSQLEVQKKCNASKEDLAHTYANMGIFERRLGKIDSAIAYGEKALELFESVLGKNHREVAEQSATLGKAWLEKDPKKAIAYFKRSFEIFSQLQLEPDDFVGDLMMTLGSAFAMMNQNHLALQSYQQGFEILVAKLGYEDELTQACLEQIRKLNPQQAESLARQYSAQRIDAFVGDVLSSFSLSEPAQPFIIAAKLASEVQNVPLAITHFETAIGLAPNNIDLILDLASLYMAGGEIEKTEGLLRKALSDHSANPDVLSALAFVLLRRKQPEEALRYAEKCLEIVPTHAEALKIHTEIRSALPTFEPGYEGLLANTKGDEAPKDDLFFQLVQLIRGGNMESLRKCEPFDPNLTDGKGNSLLTYATACNQYDMVVYLCDKGANVNLANAFGGNCVFNVLEPDKERCFNYLVSKGVKLNFCDKEGISLLHMCAQKGGCTALDRILDSGIDINSQTKNGQTALHFAVKMRQLGVGRRLIARGANIDQPDEEGLTPLILAATQGNGDFVNLLLDSQAKLISPAGHNPLFLAIMNGNLDVFKVLATRAPNLLLTKSKSGDTPLCIAAYCGQKEMIQFLLDAQQCRYRLENDEMKIALVLAIAQDHLPVVEILCPLADQEALNLGLFSSLEEKKYQMFNYLLDRCRNVAAVVHPDNGFPLIIPAVIYGTPEIVRQILAKGGDLSVNIGGRNLLHWAVEYENVAIVEWLVEGRKIAINALTEEKKPITALDIAVAKKNEAIVRIICKGLGIDDKKYVCLINKESKYGKSKDDCTIS